MSVRYIPEKVKIRLWGKAGGRCEYEGCNEPLYYDPLTKVEFNIAYIAHIIADTPGGPRGKKGLSRKLKKDIDNLMLLCDKHHRLIDKEDVEGHSDDRLKAMKERHEERIKIQTQVHEEMESHIILYGANIGKHNVPLRRDKAAMAMLPNHYPAERIIELSLKNCKFRDDEPGYWSFQRENLIRQFNAKVKENMEDHRIKHYSIFAIAPQPLLFELGHLFSDIPDSIIYQWHRERKSWEWQRGKLKVNFTILEPEIKQKVSDVALNLSLSGTIDDSAIKDVLCENTPIWCMTIKNPNYYLIRSPKHLEEFGMKFTQLLDRIKAVHGNDTLLHVFPAAPASVAIMMGCSWKEHADLKLKFYNKTDRKFIKTLDFPCEENKEVKQ